MKRNRIIYVNIVLMLVFLALLTGGGAAYNLLYAVLLIPIISFTVTAVIYALVIKKLAFYSELNEKNVPKGSIAEYRIRIKNHGGLPLLLAKVILFTDKAGLGMVKESDKLFKIPRRGEEELAFYYSGIYRGIYTVGIKTLIIYEPFCLLRLKHKINIKEELTVLPSISSMNELGLLEGALAAEAYCMRAFNEDYTEISGLRPFRQYDSYRRVHWPATAGRGELISKEYEALENSTVLFILDNSFIGAEKEAKQAEDKLMEMLSSYLYAIASGNTVITIKYLDGEQEMELSSCDFQTLYMAASKIRFEGRIPFYTVLERIYDNMPAYDDIFIFTASPDDNAGKMAARMTEHYHVVYKEKHAY